MSSFTSLAETEENSMSSAEKKHLQEITIARAYCWLIAVLHPTWSILIALFLKDEFDDLIGRFIIGASFLILGAVSYFSSSIKNHLPVISFTGYCLFAIHWFWMVHCSGMSTIYILGSLVVVFAFNLAYTHFKDLAIYSLLVVTCAIVTIIFTDSPIGNKLMLVAGIFTSQIVGMSFIYAKSTITKNLDAAETRALRLQQKLIERELEAAQIIQKNLLAISPEIAGMSLSTYYQSAGKTGGDWYGHFYDKEHSYLYMWIGDVTGHGVSSALVTGVVCGALYSGEGRFEYHKCEAKPEERIKAAAEVVNAIINEKGGGLLMTMLFCALDLKNGELHIINAGHRFPIIIDNEGKPQQIQVSGAILGFAKEAAFPIKKTILRPGETLFLYTDGLVENTSMDGKSLKRSKMNSILSTSKDCGEVVANLSTEVNQLWKGNEQADDVSMMALTWHHRIDKVVA